MLPPRRPRPPKRLDGSSVEAHAFAGVPLELGRSASNVTLATFADLFAVDPPGPDAPTEDWIAFTEHALSTRECVFGRNADITATYARLYLRHPALFKWAGMAAYASHHVRLALWPLRLGVDAEGFVEIEKTRTRYRRFHMEDIDLLRRTNAGIFADISWAHWVYDGSESGFARLAGLLEHDVDRQPMLEGFGEIEAGRQLLESWDSARRNEAEARIWRGNLSLLRHEQIDMVQPHFEQLSCRFARLFSAASTLHFSGRGPLDSMRLFCSFAGYMLVGGWWRRERPPWIPSITHFPDRWNWIEHCIVPRFQRFEAGGSQIEKDLRAFLEEADRVRCALPPSAGS